MEPTWFYYFNKKDQKSLLNSYLHISDENLLICQELENRRYTVFKNYGSFCKFFQKIPIEERCFYEMIKQGASRKPYFDIDLDNEFQFDIKKMVDVIKDLLGEKLKILVFTSHVEDKKSYRKNG